MVLYSRVALLFSLVVLLQGQTPEVDPCLSLCSCRSRDNGLIVDCNGGVNGLSINEVMSGFRATNRTGSILHLNFLGSSETILVANVFQGLSALTILTIQFSSLTEIQPGAFNSLDQLAALQLENNQLEWLSGDSFQGLGTALQRIMLDDNVLKSLRSDLEPLFASVGSVISLSDNTQLVCDCHLQWLPAFIASHPSQPRVALDGVLCAFPFNNTLITDANYTATACEDICALGYHSCSEQATCSVAGNSTVCTCTHGYSGDGLVCLEPPPVPCDPLLCSDNATCVNEPTPQCVCLPGYTGSGYSCVPMEQCQSACNETAGLYCILGSGRIDCGSKAVQDIQQMLLLVSMDPTLDPGLVALSSSLLTVARNVSVPGDLPAIIDLLTQSVDVFLKGGNYDNTTFSNLIEVGSELLHLRNQPLWSEANTISVSDHLTDLFLSIEKLGEGLFLSSGGANRLVASDNIALIVATPDCGREANITISSSLLEAPVEGGDSSLQLPPTVFGDQYECTEVGVIAVIYNGVGPLLNIDNDLLPICTPTLPPLVHGQCQWSREVSVCPDLRVNSLVISAEVVRRTNQSVALLNTTSLPDPIIITLYHENVTLENPTCSFLTDEQAMADGSWMSDGCSLVSTASSSNVTVCQCYHLTSFALLMSPTGESHASPALQIVSKVGLCISIICLIITIGLLFGLKLDTKLHHVHRQLALALCLAQLVFLVGVDRRLVPSPDVLCTLIAALLHYLFLATFAWQLVEGVHLYLFVVKVFFNKKIIWLYYPFAWGAPLIVVGITLGVRFCDYGSENFCWITNDNGANWAFHGPVIAVLLINIVIMIVVTAIIVRSSRKGSQDKILICTLLHASFVLVPILGITWALGFFVVGDTTIALIIEWIFCIFTTLQGVMIFIMHCLLNRDVRKAFLKRLGYHEAAHKQQSLTIRRSSTVNAVNNMNAAFKRKLSFTGLRRSSTGDITAFNLDTHTSQGAFTVARPHSAKARPSATNPLVMIKEEDDSLPNSLSSSPYLHRDTPPLTGKDPPPLTQSDTPPFTGEDTPPQHSRTGNGINLL